MVLEKSETLETLRERTLEAAKRHKASWIALGQYLYTIYKDKLFRTWEYMSFETYCMKELHIKQTTAVKLLKSYYFLEKEEPQILEKHQSENIEEQVTPNFESVNLLRLAKSNRNLTHQDYQDLRKSVFDSEKEPKEVRSQVKKLVSERVEEDPKEVRKTRRNATIRRLITTLNNSVKELENENLLPGYLLKQMEELVVKLEDQLE